MTTDYEPLDLAELQTEYERVTAEPGSNVQEDYLQKFVRLPERDGFTLMRILPRKKGNKLFVGTRVHTLNDPSQRDSFGRPRKKTFHCPRVLKRNPATGKDRWEGECIICKYYTDLWQQSEHKSGKEQEDLQNAARAIKPVERYYYNVIVRAEKDKDGVVQKNVGPKIYSCGKTVHEKILRACVGDPAAGEDPLGDVSHPVDGRDFRVVKKVVKGGGGTEYPNYDNSKFENPSPAGSPDELSTWLANLHDLQALKAIKTDEELRQALRVHLNKAKSVVEEDHSLDEFREGGSSASTASDSVREELVISASNDSDTETDDSVDEMVDDDFMKSLSSM